MLTYNCDSADGLTNGTSGTVTDISITCGSVSAVLIKFDDPDVGMVTRMKPKNAAFAKKYPESVPIERMAHEYSLGKLSKGHTAKAKVVQFPLTLAWALTAHKCQGQTVKKPKSLAADLKSVFTSGQAYVILGRVQDIEQLYLLSWDDKCFRVNEKAKCEAAEIEKEAKTFREQSMWTKEATQKYFKITTLNIRSLQKHYKDLLADCHLMRSDIICINETFLSTNANSEMYSLPNFRGHFASVGRGAGVAVYINNELNVHIVNVKKCVKTSHQIIQIQFPNIDILATYASPHCSLRELYADLTAHLLREKDIFICGDFNFPGQSKSKFASELANIGFQQFVKKPTHILGNMLDHVYAKCLSCEIMFCDLHATYFSDHDAICTMIDFKI